MPTINRNHFAARDALRRTFHQHIAGLYPNESQSKLPPPIQRQVWIKLTHYRTLLFASFAISAVSLRLDGPTRRWRDVVLLDPRRPPIAPSEKIQGNQQTDDVQPRITRMGEFPVFVSIRVIRGFPFLAAEGAEGRGDAIPRSVSSAFSAVKFSSVWSATAIARPSVTGLRETCGRAWWLGQETGHIRESGVRPHRRSDTEIFPVFGSGKVATNWSSQN